MKIVYNDTLPDNIDEFVVNYIDKDGIIWSLNGLRHSTGELRVITHDNTYCNLTKFLKNPSIEPGSISYGYVEKSNEK